MDNMLGKVIANLRKEKNMTQKDLAEALNISDKAISRWECGKGRPTLEMMFEISKFFGISYNDLITARISDNNEDDKIVEDIVKEFSSMGKKNAKRVKIILLFLVSVIVVLSIGMIFTHTYNRFKFYKVYVESEGIDKFYGTYVETKVRDFLYLSDIKIKNLNLADNDLISVDLYIIEDNKELILQNYSYLEQIYFVVSESDVKIDNLSDYFDDIYLRVTITRENGDIDEYQAKVQFVLEFSNNKVYYDDTFYIEEYNYEIKVAKDKDIKSILLENGYQEVNKALYLNTKDYKINYLYESDILNYSYEKDGLRYKYKYNVSSNILDVNVYDANLTVIEEYTFDIANNKMNCQIGKCSDYAEVMKILEEKVLYLFK